MLEHGRGVLLGYALDSRTDVTSLAGHHPDLADQFTTLRDTLDLAGRLSLAQPGLAADPASKAWHEAEQHRSTAEAFDRVIAQIRNQPGFSHFLRPASIRDLTAVAEHGPVVSINVSRFGSDGRAYYDKKISQGKTPKEALRALKRRISNTIYAALWRDARHAAAATAAAAAADADGAATAVTAGPGGQPGNDSASSAAGSHPGRQLFGPATPEPEPQPATRQRTRKPPPDKTPEST